ncbi:MAG: xanthine dehydrogenase family protein subunit M [Clostridia bacterium]|nr:xanthine dehydrogenase family protein subunit M [Clostridia bacterium]
MIKHKYLRPRSLDVACQLLSETRGKVLAGGTDLMVQLRAEDEKLKNINHVIDINHLKELSYIKKEDGYIHIGGLTTHQEIQESDLIQKEAAFLALAVSTVGSPQIRNRGTIGGSICNASPAADPLPPLIALNADVKLKSVRGERTLPLVSIFQKPYSTCLEPDEILVEISFKSLPETTKTTFIKLGRRKALAIARMNIAVALDFLADGTITEARIVPGSVFPTPDRVTAAEEFMLNKKPTVELIEQASKMVSEEMIKRTGIRWSTEYKQPVIENLTKRAIKQILGVE